MAPGTNYTDPINHTETSQRHRNHGHTGPANPTNTQSLLLTELTNYTGATTHTRHEPHKHTGSHKCTGPTTDHTNYTNTQALY